MRVIPIFPSSVLVLTDQLTPRQPLVPFLRGVEPFRIAVLSEEMRWFGSEGGGLTRAAPRSMGSDEGRKTGCRWSAIFLRALVEIVMRLIMDRTGTA